MKVSSGPSRPYGMTRLGGERHSVSLNRICDVDGPHMARQVLPMAIAGMVCEKNWPATISIGWAPLATSLWSLRAVG